LSGRLGNGERSERLSGRHGDHEAHTQPPFPSNPPAMLDPAQFMRVTPPAIHPETFCSLSLAANDAGRLRTLITHARTTGGLTARGGALRRLSPP
jgi:hypothetical protein